MVRKSEQQNNDVYSSFSKTLLYSQQESGNVISVKNFPASQLNSVEHALLNIHLPDFYDEKNNDAFQTYSRALIRDKKKRIGCSLIFGSQDDQITVNIMRDNLGKLMEVLFCFKFVGIPMDADAESESIADGKTVSLSRILTAYSLCLDKELPDESEEWRFLNDEINKFNDVLCSTDNLSAISDYILDKLCVKGAARPKVHK